MTRTVTEGADQAATQRALRLHAPLGARVAESLDSCRSALGVDVGDDDLRRLRHTAADSDLFHAARLLERAIQAVTDRMRSPEGPVRTARLLRVHEHLAELHSLSYEVQQEFLARQVAMLAGIRVSLQRLHAAESVTKMIDRVTEEVCRSCGVDRCTLFRPEGRSLIPESVHFAQDAEFQEEWESFARAHPPAIDVHDPEIQLLRRNQPILVADPTAVRGFRDIATAAHTRGYVAAAVIVRGSPIATIHADRYFSEASVDPIARDVLATFAQGFGYALERTMLMERMRHQFGRMRDMMAEADTTLEELFDPGLALRREDGGEVSAVARWPATVPGTDHRLLGLLTRRELEVVELLARGATNGDIAVELVISQGTVKSHVKHILRKMRVTNRAQAVSTYMRLQAQTRGARSPSDSP